MGTPAPTGYWVFYFDRESYEVEGYNRDKNDKKYCRVANTQKDFFEPGQMGVIRVKDSRKGLQPDQKLTPGIYWIVRIIGDHTGQRIPSERVLTTNKDVLSKELIEVEIVLDFFNNPITQKEINNDLFLKDDDFLTKAVYDASKPLSHKSYVRLLEIALKKLL